MIDGKCYKRYPQALISNTVARNDGILYTEDQQEMAVNWQPRKCGMLNGQHVYFTVANVQQIAPNPPAFFTLHQIDLLAKLLSYYTRIIHERLIESYLNDS
ncbi:unnamed protein product, partial [Onchocerca ochengi]|uniref:Uncharacterized protein n=1 Tax=Onchocerca ochengi TaxID=42157 RepID=A0A182EZV0_ONCOC